MKMKQLVTTAAFLVAMSLAAPSAFAITAAQKAEVKKAVTSVPIPEMPAKAAELVLKAAKQDRTDVAVWAVRYSIYKNRASAPQVVAAVAKAAPEVAAAATLAASEMEAGQAKIIASAAIAAAPSARPAILEQRAPLTRGMTRGAFDTATGTVNQTDNPINGTSGGNGAGSFAGAQANQAGAPVIVNYEDPRTPEGGG